MEFRSTNTMFVHYQGDILSNVSSEGVGPSSHGVHLTGGSTGGIVQPCGDETNIALTVRAKGSGPLNLISSGALNLGGATSTAINLPSTLVVLGTSGGQVQSGGSTAPFGGFIRTAISSFSTPAANTTNIMVVESTATFVGVTSSHYILGNSSNLSTSIALIGLKCSSADEVRMSFIKASSLAIATGTTARISFLALRF